MKVFLTGATGFIGNSVAIALLNSGHTVVGLARSDEAVEKLSRFGIEAVRADLSQTEILAQAARDAEAVIHTAADPATMAETDPAVVTAMLDAVAGTGKPFIYTGGVWELGDTGGAVVDEDAPDNPIPLVAWRPAVTRQVLAASEREVRSIVIRPSLVYGYGKGIPANLAKAANEQKSVIIVGTGENHWCFVHVIDLADLYARALSAPPGTLLHAAQSPAYKTSQVAESACRGAGIEPNIIYVPVEQARETMGGFADALALDQQISSERATNLLGWKPHCPTIIEELERGSYATNPSYPSE
ncbi:MAG: NAD-dependent epimerase/dehydratase family protein [Capsulimonadaceae bacterium]